MSNTSIQLKKSGQSGNVPSTLTHGEVALNYADGKLYYKNSTNTITFIGNQDTFSVINVDGSLILATSISDTLNLVSGNNVTLQTDVLNNRITISSSSANSYIENVANAAFVQANAAYNLANTLNSGTVDSYARNTANAAFDHANASYAAANNVFPQIQPAYNHANAAYSQANTATADAIIADSKATSAGLYANAAFIKANTPSIVANSAYDTANSAGIYANLAFTHANAVYNLANTIVSGSVDVYARDTANSASSYANSSFVQANSAYDLANIVFNLVNSGSGNSSGQIIVDNFVGNGSNSDFILSVTPTSNNHIIVNIDGVMQLHNAYSISANTITLSETPLIGQEIEITTIVLPSLGKANSSYDHANAAYNQANTAAVDAIIADSKATSAGLYSNLAYTQANSAYDLANTIFNLANNAQPGNITVENFLGNGSNSDFSLSVTPTSNNHIIVNIDGVIQLHNSYSLLSNTITLSEVPVNGQEIEVTVINLGDGFGGNNTYISITQLKNVVSSSTDFADFKSRIALL